MGRVAKIKEIDRASCKRLRVEMDKVLIPLGKKLGVDISTGNASYSAENASFKVKVATLGADGTVRDEEAEAFKKNAFMFGLKPEMLNTTFKSFAGDTFEIVGLATRSRKYPVLAKNILSGKTFKFPVEQIKQHIK